MAAGQKPLPPWGESQITLLGVALSRPTPIRPDLTWKFGRIYRTRMMGMTVINMAGAEACRFVLSSGMEHFQWKGGYPDSFSQLLGHGLFTIDGRAHRKRRALLQPAFHGRALTGYTRVMQELCARHMERWARQAEITWLEENRKLTFDIASTLLLGARPGQDTARLSRHFRTMTEGLLSLPVNLPFTTFGKAQRSRAVLRRFLYEAVRERHNHPGEDALSMLVVARDEAGEGLGMEEVIDEAMLLTFAGHETTTSMLTSVCLELSRNPQVLARARREQQELGIEGLVTMEQMGKMTYLDQILREVERLYPPVPGGFRRVVKSFDFDGYHVPVGSLVVYGAFESGRDPGIYRQPHRFDPDRFGPERNEQQPFSLLGFGGGPRVCLGMTFAKTEMKIVLSHLLRNYQWELMGGQDFGYLQAPSLHPADGLHVRLRPLEKPHAEQPEQQAS